MMNSYPWYLADWFSSEKVASFSLESRTIYRELIDHCWNNGSLPNDEKILQNLARCSSAEWKRNRAAIVPCFTLKEDNRLHLQKVDEKRPAMVEARAGRAAHIKGVNDRRNHCKPVTATDTVPVTATDTETDTPRAGARPPSPSPSPLHPTDVLTPLPPKGGAVSPTRNGTQNGHARTWRDNPAFESVTSEMFNRHRQGRKTTLDETGRALMAKIESAVDPIREVQSLNDRHAAWCSSDDWTRGDGRYVPWLGKWLASPKSDAEPPLDSGDAPCF